MVQPNSLCVNGDGALEIAQLVQFLAILDMTGGAVIRRLLQDGLLLLYCRGIHHS